MPKYKIYTAYVLSFAGSYKLGSINMDMVTLLHITYKLTIISLRKYYSVLNGKW